MLKRKYGLIFCTSIFLVWILVSGLVWLFVVIIVIIIVHRLTLRILTFFKSRNVKLGEILKVFFLIVFIFILSIGLRLLVLDIYKIPSSSMNNTLYTNDVIVVNKVKYGPKLPRSPFEIPWVNIAFYLNEKARKSIKDNWWDYHRLSGTTPIKNGDVIVFDMFSQNIVIVKRCMAIAGDTLEIKRGNVYINNESLNPSKNIVDNYEFKVRERRELSKKLDSLNFDINLYKIGKSSFRTNLTREQKIVLKTMALIDSVKIVTDTLPVKYPESKFVTWTLDNYGPYIIPKKGMTISLTSENYSLYNKVINDHEGIELKHTEGLFYLNNKQVVSYTFKKDYYFMMGDNRMGSEDSRFWGLVPEDRIIGKVQCVLVSNFRDKFQWSRLLKTIN